MPASLRSEYLLDPTVTYLNHGSFGGCPRVVFETWQRYQRELETNPVRFLSHDSGAPLRAAREKLAAYLGAEANNLVFMNNPTHAFMLVARTLELGAGDEILATAYEYPAMEQGWQYIAQKTGARYVHQPVPLPLESHEQFVGAFWQGVNERTKVIHLSHIMAGLAMVVPVEEICRRAREAGILTIVDGAHAPSQLDLNLEEIGADYYFGACHKWLSAPKGTGFLYASPRVQPVTEPLVVSGGWLREKPMPPREEADGLSWFVALNSWQGTRDPSGFLAIPSAIDFQAEHQWAEQRQRCHELASQTRAEMEKLTGLRGYYPYGMQYFRQMVSFPVGKIAPGELYRRLWEDYRTVVIVGQLNETTNVRVSFQAYNDERDVEHFLSAMKALLETTGEG